MPQSRWISIYQTRERHTVEIIKLKLEAAGIPVQVWNQVDSSYMAFGYIHVNVLNEDLERAKALIEEFQ